jgi:hypothetical protein
MAVDLKKWALLAEIFGGVGIIISVLYLGYQVSENTTNIQAANALSISSETMASRQSLIDDADLADLVLKGRSETDRDVLTGNERFRFFAYTLNRLTIWENLLLMNKQGLLPHGFFGPLDSGHCVNFRQPGYRFVWQGFARNYFSDDLKKRVDECFADE